MEEIKIKTWSCSICGYKQDFEPTEILMNEHFNRDNKFKLSDVKPNECPSCRLKGNSETLKKEVIVSKKMRMQMFIQSDIPLKRAELLAKPKQVFVIGVEKRLETESEHDKRIDSDIGLTDSMKVRVKSNRTLSLVEVPIKEEETDKEQIKRIDDELSEIKVVTSTEVQKIRDKYEDK